MSEPAQVAARASELEYGNAGRGVNGGSEGRRDPHECSLGAFPERVFLGERVGRRLRLLDDIALQDHVESEPGWKRCEEGADSQWEAIEREPVAVRPGHGQGPAVGSASHHALPTLTVRSHALPR